MTEEQIISIVEILSEIEQDHTVPKNIKRKLNEIVEILRGKEDESIKINKAVSEMEEILDDQNMQPFTRNQLLNVISALEMI